MIKNKLFYNAVKDEALLNYNVFEMNWNIRANFLKNQVKRGSQNVVDRYNFRKYVT